MDLDGRVAIRENSLRPPERLGADRVDVGPVEADIVQQVVVKLGQVPALGRPFRSDEGGFEQPVDDRCDLVADAPGQAVDRA